MVLNEGRIKRFVLMSLDDVLDNPPGEVLEVLLCAQICRDKPIELLVRCSYVAKRDRMTYVDYRIESSLTS